MNTDRIYVADMWTNQATYKAKGWKPYYIESGELKPVLASRCRNQWGRIYLITDEEFEKLKRVGDNVKTMIELEQKKLELYNKLFEAVITEYIIKQ